MSTPKLVDPRPWGIYARLSKKKSTRTIGKGGRKRRLAGDDLVTCERQVRKGKEWADENDILWSPDHIYIDNDLSAWKEKGGKRPAWLAMMDAIRRGELAGVIVFMLDRFTRSPQDMQVLINYAEAKVDGKRNGMVIAGPLAGSIDLSTADGIYKAREAANKAELESGKISERAKAEYEEARRDGDLMGGARVFGFAYAGCSDHHPVEAPIVREMARLLIAGKNNAEIVTYLESTGIRPTSDGPWYEAHVNLILRKQRYGGWATYYGERMGRITDNPPILEEGTFEAVQAILSSRRHGKKASGAFTLSGLAICGECQAHMTGAASGPATKRVKRYGCSNHKCRKSAPMDAVDAKAFPEIIRIYADRDTQELMAGRNATARADRTSLTGEILSADGMLADAMTKKLNGGLEESEYDATRAYWLARKRKAQAALEELPPAGGITIATPADLEQAELEWDGMSFEQRQTVIRALGIRITIDPASTRGARWDPARVHVRA